LTGLTVGAAAACWVPCAGGAREIGADLASVPVVILAPSRSRDTSLPSLDDEPAEVDSAVCVRAAKIPDFAENLVEVAAPAPFWRSSVRMVSSPAVSIPFDIRGQPRQSVNHKRSGRILWACAHILGRHRDQAAAESWAALSRCCIHWPAPRWRDAGANERMKQRPSCGISGQTCSRTSTPPSRRDRRS